MSSEPAYADDDSFEPIATEKHKYRGHYIVVEIRQQSGATDGDKRASVAVHEPTSGVLGSVVDVFRTKELQSWSWGIEEDEFEDELIDAIRRAKDYIDDRQSNIAETEDHVRNAFRRAAPESERRPDYRRPTRLRAELSNRVREAVASRLTSASLTIEAVTVLSAALAGES